MICPCLSSRSKYAICGRFKDGLMVPSVFERENYCFGTYELCPLFSERLKEVIDEKGYEPILVEYGNFLKMRGGE